MASRLPGRMRRVALVLVVALALATLFIGISGGRRPLLAAVAVVALLVGVTAWYYLRASRAAVVGLALALLLSPWAFGLTNNALQGWHDHVLYWGRSYNRSDLRPNDIDARNTQPYYMLLIGSTWIPWDAQTDLVLVFETSPDPYLVYSLVGG